MDVWIGTSGYSYIEWIGDFYPPGTSTAKMLRFYARHFPLVEFNSSFYRVPNPDSLARLADGAPRGFQFVLKGHQSLTHDQVLDQAPAMRLALEALAERGRLTGLLLQWPQRFHHGPAALAWLEQVTVAFAGLPVFVEFRHGSWAKPEVATWLSLRHLHHVSVDVPNLPGLFPAGLRVSSRTAYIRLHSRRAEHWHADDGERYDYQYSDAELHTWLEELERKSESLDAAYFLFNNCHQTQAPPNALRLMQLVERFGRPFHLVEPFRHTATRQGWLFEDSP